MTEEQVKKAFLEKTAITYTTPERPAESYEYIYALRYVRQGEKVGVFAELNGKQLIREDGSHPNCVMTVPIRYLSVNGAVEAKKKAKMRLSATSTANIKTCCFRTCSLKS